MSFNNREIGYIKIYPKQKKEIINNQAEDRKDSDKGGVESGSCASASKIHDPKAAILVRATSV